ncbi:hypothetical protein BCR34DRAFT_112805 [Clohesyomyces aquaticus]|uniref:Uncharacterized protein n=1 Tax=Clohesyomyces aquaticus TaxID=1231657 RepID=A0A1Y1YQR0_9PLEO|nr:hypothetical protein BCR34DRAFT_112805 [Clohesyomyces aquaticus]
MRTTIHLFTFLIPHIMICGASPRTMNLPTQPMSSLASRQTPTPYITATPVLRPRSCTSDCIILSPPTLKPENSGADPFFHIQSAADTSAEIEPGSALFADSTSEHNRWPPSFITRTDSLGYDVIVPATTSEEEGDPTTTSGHPAASTASAPASQTSDVAARGRVSSWLVDCFAVFSTTILAFVL